MNLQRQLSILALAVAAALPAALPGVAAAQTAASAADPRIFSLGVEQTRRLRPGNVLAFRLNGTPGASATLQLSGATQTLPLTEIRPGEYAGEYTIRSRDRLTAASTVTAQLTKNGRTASAMLGRSLLVGARDPAPVASAPITAFTVSAADGIQPGDELMFSLKGRPGGTARVAVQGIDRPIVLSEVSRGVYEGSYVLRRQDRLHNDLVADGYLISDRRETSQRFERRSERDMSDNGRNEYRDNRENRENRDNRDNRDNRESREYREGRQQAVATCASCGSIEAVNVVDVKSDAPNILGTIAGGLLGGVVGNQVGGGSGKDLATVIGAVGGAYAGNRAENKMGTTKVFRITVRLDGGATQNFDYASDPSVQVGTRVRVENGALVRL